jgi:sugar phosphate isomerase/epimerase
MLAQDEAKTGTDIIPLAASLGYDYMEAPLAQVMALPKKELDRYTRLIERVKTPLEVCNNFFPAYIQLTGEAAQYDEALEYAQRACSWASNVGVKVIGLGSPGARNIPPRFPHKEAEKQLVELLCGLEEIVKLLGITIVLEPINSKEANFVTTTKEALRLVRKVNQEHIKLLIDYYHLYKESEDLAIVGKAAIWLRHIHIASKVTRNIPHPEDDEAYENFFSRLKAAGYNQRISIEGGSADFASEGAAALEMLRRLTD